MNLRIFSTINRARCDAAFHPLDAWTPTDWATALAGEVGELCNLIKKFRRGDFAVGDPDLHPDEYTLEELEPIMDAARVATDETHDAYWLLTPEAHDAIAAEIGDVLAYLDLLAQRLGIDLGDATRDKFNAVSERIGSGIRMPPDPDLREDDWPRLPCEAACGGTVDPGAVLLGKVICGSCPDPRRPTRPRRRGVSGPGVVPDGTVCEACGEPATGYYYADQGRDHPICGHSCVPALISRRKPDRPHSCPDWEKGCSYFHPDDPDLWCVGCAPKEANNA